MIITLTRYQAADILLADEYAGWSRPAALALVDHYEHLEEERTTPIEMDIVAVRCEWSEYPHLIDWAREHRGEDYKYAIGIDDDAEDDEIDEAIREYIQDRGELIEFEPIIEGDKGGVLVSAF